MPRLFLSHDLAQLLRVAPDHGGAARRFCRRSVTPCIGIRIAEGPGRRVCRDHHPHSAEDNSHDGSAPVA
jgi:hypothetical protein